MRTRARSHHPLVKSRVFGMTHRASFKLTYYRILTRARQFFRSRSWRTIAGRADFLGDQMNGWKKAVVVGSIGAAALLFMKKKYPAGVLATGVGLAVLASEYPEKFEKVRRKLPDYFERGMQVMEMAGRAGKRFTEAAGKSAIDAWEEIGG
jgi:hypothetical protein